MSSRTLTRKQERLDVLRSLLDTPRRHLVDRYTDRQLLELQDEAEHLAEQMGVAL